MKWAIAAINGLIGAVVALPALFYLIDPRRRPGLASDFRRVSRIADLPLDEPTQVTIRDQRVDAWTRHSNDLVGRVWLIRRASAPDKVEAYTSICPHMGCSINFEASERRFACPCHGGLWDFYCQRLNPETNPARRDMDRLDVELQKDGATDDMWVAVKYEQFMSSIPEKKLKV
jgi:nitrite reductase/ring-hydroxylating ferredoxin subunit